MPKTILSENLQFVQMKVVRVIMAAHKYSTSFITAETGDADAFLILGQCC